MTIQIAEEQANMLMKKEQMLQMQKMDADLIVGKIKDKQASGSKKSKDYEVEALSGIDVDSFRNKAANIGSVRGRMDNLVTDLATSRKQGNTTLSAE